MVSNVSKHRRNQNRMKRTRKIKGGILGIPDFGIRKGIRERFKKEKGEEIEQIDYGTINDDIEVVDTALEETVNDEDIIRPKKKSSTLDDGISETKRKGKKNNV